MREKRLHLCQVINSTFLEFGTLNEKEFNDAIKIALEVPLPFSLAKNVTKKYFLFEGIRRCF